MLGKNLVTHQTGPEGRQVRRVLVEQGFKIERELYLAMVLDRAQSRVTVICSSEGGVEIEEVAAKHPEKILKETVDPVIGLAAFQCRRLAFALAIPPRVDRQNRRRHARRFTAPSRNPTLRWPKSIH